jgi:hypothetical protein
MVRLLACAMALWLSSAAAHAADLQPFAVDVLGWFRMPSTEFGCRLEKSLGHRDPKFNCDLANYTPLMNPCLRDGDWYEGPAFPQALAARVHPLATQVDIKFEHGNLQGVLIVLRGRFTDQQVRRALGLPDDGKLPGNIMSLGIQSSDAGQPEPTTRLLIQGFDHMGGADVDCPVSDRMAGDPEPARSLVDGTARNLERGTVDLAHARIEPGSDGAIRHAGLCTGDARFVASLKAQLLLQVFGNYALESAAGWTRHQSPPEVPSPFDTNGRDDVTLKDLLHAPEPLVRLGEALAAHSAVLARYRTVALAGIDDLLRFEALERVLTVEEREELESAYWNASLAAFHANPTVRTTLGTIAPCYGESYFLEKVKVADRDTFANLSPLANYYLMFWMRRHADGNTDLVRSGLVMVQAALGS